MLWLDCRKDGNVVDRVPVWSVQRRLVMNIIRFHVHIWDRRREGLDMVAVLRIACDILESGLLIGGEENIASCF